MRMKTIKKGVLTLAAASLVFALPLAALAEDEGSIIVDPVKETVMAQAGDVVDLTMEITNNTDMDKQIDIMFSEFTVDESGIPSVTEGSDAAHTWFVAEPAQAELAAGASQEVAITATIPSDAEEKGYYVMAAVGIASITDETASTTTKQEIQALYSLVVGEPAESVEISRISSAEGTVVIAVDNMANVHSAVSGKLELMMGEDIIATYSVESTNVFPGKTRNIMVAVTEADLQSYTAKASLAYGTENTVISMEQDLADVAATDDGESVTVTNTATVVSDDDEDTNWILYGLVAAAAVLVVVSVMFYAKKK